MMETLVPIFIIMAVGIIAGGLVIGAVTLLWLGGMLLWRRLATRLRRLTSIRAVD
jgi:hypothetical protein